MAENRTHLDSTFENINSLCESKDYITGPFIGFNTLDYMKEGLQPSELVLVVACTSIDRIAFALNMASFIGQQNQGAVAYFTLEMSKKQLVQHMLCFESRIDVEKFLQGDLDDDEWTSLCEASERLSEAPIYIDDTNDFKLMEMCSKVRNLKKEQKLSTIFIDYPQLMPGEVSKNSDKHKQKISKISRTLKELAREVNVPIVLMAQLPHSLNIRQDKRLMLSDIREFGSLEHDADMVMFLYSDGCCDRGTEINNIMEVIIAKHRNGLLDTVKLHC